MRKGPSFSSRLLLNSSADWQGYKIGAIWELFGSLGPVPREQVQTGKKLPESRLLQTLGCTQAAPGPPSTWGSTHSNLHSQLSVTIAKQIKPINENVTLWPDLHRWWCPNTLLYLEDSLQNVSNLNQILFWLQKASVPTCWYAWASQTAWHSKHIWMVAPTI